MKTKPFLSFWQIWNLTFGFLGIQFGFALQNANSSRILQTYGAGYELGAIAMRLLIERLNGVRDGDRIVSKIIKTNLVVRQSTR